MWKFGRYHRIILPLSHTNTHNTGESLGKKLERRGLLFLECIQTSSGLVDAPQMPTVPTKRAASPANSANMDETISFTSRKPTWGYLKLEL